MDSKPSLIYCLPAAQNLPQSAGQIEARAVDPGGLPLSAASVTVRACSPDRRNSAKPTSSGIFMFPGLC